MTAASRVGPSLCHVFSHADEVAVMIAFATRVAAAHIASATIRLPRLELSGREVFRQSEREPRRAYVAACMEAARGRVTRVGGRWERRPRSRRR